MSNIIQKTLINGQWISAENNKLMKVYNPATSETIAKVPDCGSKETELAIQAAKDAFGIWSKKTPRERSVYLYDAYHLMLERKELLSRVLTAENGKPLVEARGEIEQAARFLLWFAEEASRAYGEVIPASNNKNKRFTVISQPIGVVAAITPWNFPASMVNRKIAPALAAGCTVVLKPSEQTPLSAIKIMEILEEVGIPKGVVNLVTGDPTEIGNKLMECSDVRMITFTGSTEVGKLLMSGSAQNVKKLSLELGGHAPFLVFDDADLDLATDQAIASKFRNSGQACISVNRIYVHESVQDEFIKMFVDKAKDLKLGNGMDEDTNLGPLIEEKAFNKVKNHFEDAVSKGAKVELGGSKWNGLDGYFFEPTILSHITNDMKIMYEETFGPIVPVKIFNNLDDLIKEANDTEHGLAAYIFTNDLNKATLISEKLDYGVIGINDVSPGVAEAPFGGMKQSGLGREGGIEGMKEFMETKFISLSIS